MKKRIPWSYRKDFLVLSQELIFNEPNSLKRIGFKTITEISTKIQQNIIDGYEISEKRKEKELEHFIMGYRLQIIDLEKEVRGLMIDVKPIPEEKLPLIKNATVEPSDLKFIQTHIVVFSAMMGKYVYDAWAFTPKYMFKATDDSIHFNCFGHILLLGSYCKKRGIKVDFGITPDHPYLVAYLEEGVHIADSSGVQKLKGNLEEYLGYKLYRPIEEEKDFDSKDYIVSMIVVVPFDEGLLYEILENIEVLRRISLGDHKLTLPGSYVSGKELSQTKKGALQGADWKDLQSELFPEITNAFIVHQREWYEEVDRISKIRGNQYGQKVWQEVSIEAQKGTSFSGLEYKEGQLALKEEFKLFTTEIIHYLFLDKGYVFPENVSENTRSYFKVVRSEIERRKLIDQIEAVHLIGYIMSFIQRLKTKAHFTKEESADITN